MYKCDICGKEFETKEKLGGHKSGHSRLGKPRNKTTTNTKTSKERYCKNCGKLITKRRNVYCSIDCFREYEKKNSFYRGMDITVAELDRYREEHPVCEICGRPETMKINGNKCSLAVDHDHKTNKFRGLLCYSCNTKLSWYENWKDKIEKYLLKNADVG